ncbi:hypothetical protein ATPR_1065 [Acetobacter tropicalis NBRC 101654]|uniref:Uncharacterized protein n=1 Tax=Acetobacter tropicalis NBRC 101654 TaxID=749388 RepID=F7VCG6_9PROT|nr:hypothetical protein ATPR_1065 [Acetobacter tropicalis NBRC 101654]
MVSFVAEILTGCTIEDDIQESPFFEISRTAKQKRTLQHHVPKY